MCDAGDVSGDGGVVSGEGLIIPQDREHSEKAAMFTVSDGDRMDEFNELPFAVLDSVDSNDDGTEML